MTAVPYRRSGLAAWPSTDRQAITAIALYFGLHFLLRILAPGSLELDEGAELIRTQEFRLGYDTQPPLYTWLLWPLIQAFGPAVWPLALLKNLLLFGTHVYVYAAARRLRLPPATALVVGASLLLIPQIGWESQRDLTHSVLVTHVAAGTLLLSLDLLYRQTVWHYAGLGLLLATGMLAKYNFAVFALALLFTALGLPQARRLVFQPWFSVTVLLMLLAIAPHALWLLDEWSAVTARSLRKMGLEEPFDLLGGTTALLAGVGQFIGLFALVAGACLMAPRLRRRRLIDFTQTGGRMLTLLHSLNAALIFAMVVAFGMSEVKDRWLQPLFFATPLWLFAYLDWDALAAWQRNSYRWILASAACTLLLGRAIDIHGSPYFDRPTRLGTPFADLVDGLELPSQAVVLANNNHLGGGIRLRRSDLDVYTPSRRTPPPDGACYLVWQPTKQGGLSHYRAWLQEMVSDADKVMAQRVLAAAVPYPSQRGMHRLFVANGRCQAPRSHRGNDAIHEKTIKERNGHLEPKLFTILHALYR